MPQRPDLRHERSLLRSGARLVVGMDEVGRGALAGPVSVGAVAVDARTRSCPPGVADSKLLTPAARQRLLPALGRWGIARAVGHASSQEIDALGIIAALRLAGRRALVGLGVVPDVVLLDGSHDWLSLPRQALFYLGSPVEDPWAAVAGPDDVVVRTRVKADRFCASVAAASVLAKCERDSLMVLFAQDHPAYGWAENKGYGAPEHLAALREMGPSPLHRCSWRLPLAEQAMAAGVAADELAVELAEGLAEGPAEGVVAPRWSMMEA